MVDCLKCQTWKLLRQRELKWACPIVVPALKKQLQMLLKGPHDLAKAFSENSRWKILWFLFFHLKLASHYVVLHFHLWIFFFFSFLKSWALACSSEKVNPDCTITTGNSSSSGGYSSGGNTQNLRFALKHAGTWSWANTERFSDV